MKLRDNRPFEVHGHVWSTDGIATVGRHGWTEGLVEAIVFKGGRVDRICRTEKGVVFETSFLGRRPATVGCKRTDEMYEYAATSPRRFGLCGSAAAVF